MRDKRNEEKEASDINLRLYGDARLLSALDRNAGSDMKGLREGVRRDVDDFVGSAAQFDDITMLALKYNGPEAAPPEK